MVVFVNICVIQADHRISTFNNDTHDIFQGDTSVANEKWSISWEQGKICSDWWFADPSNSRIRDQGKADAPRKGSKPRRANAATLFHLDQHPQPFQG